MKKALTLFLFLSFLFIGQNLHAQQIELFGGVNTNFYLYNPHSGYDNGHNSKSTELKIGYSFGGIYYFKLDGVSSPLSWELMLNNYKNEFGYSTGGQGGSVSNNFTK